MKIPARKRRLLPAVLAVAVVGGLAAGIVVGCGGSASARAQGPPGVLAQGKFRSIGWGTNGTASIVREASGRLQLRFSGDFQTQPAPELFVYLAKYVGGRRTEWTQVAPLRRAWGRQAYDLSSVMARDLRVSVSIYCAKCNRAWGEAPLRPTGDA